MEFWLWMGVAACALGQIYFAIRTHQILRSLERPNVDARITRAQETADAALSSSFGVALEVAGIAKAWPSNGMSSAEFGDLVADWIIETGRQGLSLAELKECVDRGDHKGCTGDPKRQR